MSAAGNSSELGNMSTISQNISALLEVSLEDHGIPHITAETSGDILINDHNIHDVSLSVCFFAFLNVLSALFYFKELFCNS